MGSMMGGAKKVKGFEMTDAAKQGEADTLNNLRAKVNGTGQYVSDLQYKQAMDDMMKNNQSMAASARGVSNPGLMQRNAMMTSQQGQVDLARSSAAAKLQEQQDAQNQMIAAVNAQRGTAFQQASTNAAAQNAQKAQTVTAISNMGSSAAMAASDENLKKNIHDGGGDSQKVISEFLDALKAHTYEYKNKSDNGRENPEGEVTSVMAQELEKSKVGKRAVKEGPDGKEVDYAQLMAPMLASMAELNKRLKTMEKKNG